MPTLSKPPASASRATFLDHKAIVEDWVATYSPAQLNWKPTPKRWSVAECIQHLNRAAGIYVPVLEEVVPTLPPGGPPFDYGGLARFSLKIMGPDTTMKFPAPPVFKPRSETTPTASGFAPAVVIGEFTAFQDRFAGIMDAGEGRDLSAKKMGSPAMKLWRMPIGAWAEAMAAHQARHLQQAQRVLAEPGFPSA